MDKNEFFKHINDIDFDNLYEHGIYYWLKYNTIQVLVINTSIVFVKVITRKRHKELYKKRVFNKEELINTVNELIEKYNIESRI